MKNKLNKPNIRESNSVIKTNPNSKIKEIQDIKQTEISFSLKYWDINHDKFTFKKLKNNYFEKFLERMKNLCTMKKMEIIENRSPALRVHPIKWNETSEPYGFKLHEQLNALPPYQFEISANEHGRVHGFFIGETFFIVWFDPKHLLYPAK